MSLIRRDIVRLTGAVLAVFALVPRATASGAGRNPPRCLSRLFADFRSAEVIGRAYLLSQGVPLTASGPVLASLWAGCMSALELDAADLRDHGGGSFEARFRDRIRLDFTEGNVVIVDGWMLSWVEAQACAIACLSATDNTRQRDPTDLQPIQSAPLPPTMPALLARPRHQC